VTGLADTAWKTAVRRLDFSFLRIVVAGSPEEQDLYCGSAFARSRKRERCRSDQMESWLGAGRTGPSDVQDAATKLGTAICAVLDLPSLSTVPREQAEPSNPATQRCSHDNQPTRYGHE
jgi:hypothetical protein